MSYIRFYFYFNNVGIQNIYDRSQNINIKVLMKVKGKMILVINKIFIERSNCLIYYYSEYKFGLILY